MTKTSRLLPEIFNVLDFDAQDFANTLRAEAKTSRLLPRRNQCCTSSCASCLYADPCEDFDWQDSRP